MIYIFGKMYLPSVYDLLDHHDYNVLIRIKDPLRSIKEVEAPGYFKDVLVQEYYDRDTPGDGTFTDSHMQSLIRFFTQHQKADNVLIHCNAGISRSSAIAVGLCMFRNDYGGVTRIFESGRFKPNILILKELCTHFHYDFEKINRLYQAVKHIRFEEGIYCI